MDMGQHQEEFLVSLLVALGAGIAFGLGGPELPFLPLLAALAGLLAWAAWGIHRASRQVWPAFLLAAFLLGLLRFQSSMLLLPDDISHFAGQELRVAGRLTETPQARERSDGSVSVRYCLRAEKVRQGQEEERSASGNLYVYARLPKEEAAALPQLGDTLLVRGSLRLPHGFHNPGQIDTEMLLRSQGITATLIAAKGGLTAEALPEREVPAWTGLLRRLAAVREHYLSSMQAVMPKEDAAAIFAMLFGGYQGLQPELLESFTATGIVHILSVSGSHISLLAAVMAWVSSLLHLPKIARVVLVISVIAVYSMLAGLVPPVIRSALMGGLAFLALALDREKDARRLLLLTGLFMLAISPLLLFHISFQLSFAATAGLLYVAPVARDWLQARRVPPVLSAGLAITLGAHASTLPIIAWYFNQLSLSAFLANIVIVPLVELIIVAGIAAGLVAYVMPLAGAIAYAGDSLLLGLVYELARWMAALPGSQVWIPSLGWQAAVAYYLGLASVVLREPWRQKLWAGLCARRAYLLAILAALVAFGMGYRLSQADMLTLSIIDCGQGDAACLQTAHGKAILFDCGGERYGNEPGAFNTGERVIVPYLRHYGINEVEAIFLTHAHADHAGGAGAVLKKMPVGSVYTADEGREAYAQSMGIGSADPLLQKLHPAREGAVFEVDGARIEVVYAPSLSVKGAESGNEASNVYRIVYGNASFLITGDLTKENEKAILEKGSDIRCTVLKVGHHGSNTSSSEEFLQAAQPFYAAICVGADNSFGHPKAEVLERLKGIGAKILRTDQDGEIKFRTDGKTMRVETYAE
ncbi:MAG: DNA internalization-related competence protein ComEC/Rec2 [Selenomonas ruminantium]|nr:DNA internalization-related competence protein ComEC/Rec2 [Selenomonas ruminantium]